MSGNNAFTSALIGQTWWDVGGDATITYNFANDYGAGWTSAERALFDAVFRSYEAVCNVSFVETARSSAEIVENRITSDLARTLRPSNLNWEGWHDEPGTGERSGFYVYTAAYWGNPVVGGKAHWLALHEIGHALGLEHPHSDWHGSGLFPGVDLEKATDAGDHGLNSILTTAMTYRLTRLPSGVESYDYGQTAGPMAFDIAALQEVYGAREHRTGDDTYVLPGSNGVGTYWTCIWDTGGTDAIVYAGDRDVAIDLRQANLENRPGGGGWFSSVAGILGGASIANGVVIENASAGSGDDKVTGNYEANRLSGGAGKDVLWGGPGNDVLLGGSGNDVLYGDGGNDVFVGHTGNDRFFLGDDTSRDIVVAGNLDTIYQFDSGEDKIDIARFDVDWLKVVADGGRWVIHADYDNDPQADLTIMVIGQRPLSRDIFD